VALKDEVEREPVDATAAVVVSMENLLLCVMCSCEEFVSPSLIPLATADIVDDVFRWRCISIGRMGMDGCTRVFDGGLILCADRIAFRSFLRGGQLRLVRLSDCLKNLRI